MENLDLHTIVTLICLVAGAVVSGIVSLFKGWSLVKNYPKLVAMGLSIIITIIGGLTVWGLDWTALVACTLVPFSAAVATHEVVAHGTNGDVIK